MHATGPSLPSVWQVGSGDDARPYIKWMRDNQLVAIGPGWAGRWPSTGYGSGAYVRRFAEKPCEGDLVVAKQGRHTALAIGVLGPYDFSSDLDDIEGWDLCHFRRVLWLTENEHHFGRAVFAVDRFSQCHDTDVLAWVKRSIGDSPLDPPKVESLPPLETAGPRLNPQTLDPELREVIELARWWQDNAWGEAFAGRPPREIELLTHVTVPLLRALGWPPQQIAIGWRYADIVLFSEESRIDEHVRVIIEGKRIGQGLRWAEGQAERYAGKLGHMVDLVTTDGLRYKLVRPGNDDRFEANLPKLRASAEKFFDALRYPMS
jgi:hypothetical protein